MSSFWDRRKQAIVAEQEAERDAERALAAEQAEQKLAEKSDEELLAEAGQPEPEALESPEAVREFMNSALPQRLKTRALRRLWRLNPVLANLDGLVDYGEDFTDAATVVENLQTAYQVGKGMLSHIEAMAAQDAASEETETAEDETEEAESAPFEIAVAPEPEPVLEPIAPQEAEPVEPEVAAPARRRMTFTFDETAAT
ncbi:DUF3306 domain-containing protein [Roseobacteraceae bacterium S113]